MLEIVKRDESRKFLLKLSSREHLKWIDEDLTKYPNLVLEFEKKLPECVKKSKVAIAASGTVTLELALMGLPTIVVYKTDLSMHL